MPRNSSGIYSLPPNDWNPALPDTTISTGGWNETANDLADALTGSIAADGTTVVNTNIPFAGGITGDVTGDVTGDLFGNADTATVADSATSAATLTTGRTIAITGDLAYTSPTFNGSGNVTAAGTLATVNSNVGTFGSATQVAQVTVNAKGLVTAAANVTISTTPPGSVVAYAGATVPTDWLECNGAAVPRATYAALFTAIGVIYGVGNGTTTFNLPDARGYFVRGYDNGRGIDSGRALGSNQAGSVIDHTHGYAGSATASGTTAGAPQSSADQPFDALITGGVTAPNNGGTETRPVNIAMFYIIKT